MKTNEIDMCSGKILGKMLRFALPVVLTIILQQFFNTADLIVVGKFGHDGALAAVGTTVSVSALLINFFNGLSVGAGVTLARHYGAKEFDRASKCVHTSVVTAFVSGIFMAVAAMSLTRTILRLMHVPSEIFEDAAIYMIIYFAGMPFLMLFNFLAAMLRAVGDSKRTLYYMIISGLCNIVLNLFFVIVLDMNTAGVALATVISLALAAFLSLRCFVKYDGCLALDIKKMAVDKSELRSIIAVGLPNDLQNSMFALSNTVVQSAVNTFGETAMSAWTSSNNIADYIYLVMTGLNNAVTNFTGQNYGAQKFGRIKKTIFCGLGIMSVSSLSIGGVLLIFARPLMSLYTNNSAAIDTGYCFMVIMCSLYILYGAIEVLSGTLAGLCSTVAPMIISLFGACIFRLFWMYVVFPRFRFLETIYWLYPVSWVVTLVPMIISLCCVYKKRKRASEEQI